MGEGTWAMGKPGLIMNLDVDGEKIVTDNTWKSFLADSWKPGQYKRSFLRTLQECFDANKFPYGWDTADSRKMQIGYRRRNHKLQLLSHRFVLALQNISGKFMEISRLQIFANVRFL